jgi:hypothetical protein
MARRGGLVLCVILVGGCAAILGREDIAFDQDGADGGNVDRGSESRDRDDAGFRDAAPAVDAARDTGSPIDSGNCLALDVSCDAGSTCCPGTECRAGQCKQCLSENGDCSSGRPCCGTLQCNGTTCVP